MRFYAGIHNSDWTVCCDGPNPALDVLPYPSSTKLKTVLKKTKVHDCNIQNFPVSFVSKLSWRKSVRKLLNSFRNNHAYRSSWAVTSAFVTKRWKKIRNLKNLKVFPFLLLWILSSCRNSILNIQKIFSKIQFFQNDCERPLISLHCL